MDAPERGPGDHFQTTSDTLTGSGIRPSFETVGNRLRALYGLIIDRHDAELERETKRLTASISTLVALACASATSS